MCNILTNVLTHPLQFFQIRGSTRKRQKGRGVGGKRRKRDSEDRIACMRVCASCTCALVVFFFTLLLADLRRGMMWCLCHVSFCGEKLCCYYFVLLIFFFGG